MHFPDAYNFEIPELGIQQSGSRARLADGFSLLELMISIAILLVIMGGAGSLFVTEQKISGTEQLKADMYLGIRAAAELMAQEIGQAGLVSLPTPLPTLAAGVTASSTAQAVTVSSVTSMFVGEKLLIDAGSSQELVTVTALSTSPSKVTAVFNSNHATGAVINAAGVYSNGVMTSSTATKLQLFGDISSDGSLVFIHYDCNTTAGTLSRSITTVTPTVTASSTSEVLLSNLTANPGGTACFQYTTLTSGGYTFVTNVAVTLSVRTSRIDPQTRTYLTMTKSFLNLAPRNVLAGLELAGIPYPDRLQPTPPNLPLS
jgi:prepilin-type N-terminal cleavage/methylation domain-containing protein